MRKRRKTREEAGKSGRAREHGSSAVRAGTPCGTEESTTPELSLITVSERAASRQKMRLRHGAVVLFAGLIVVIELTSLNVD